MYSVPNPYRLISVDDVGKSNSPVLDPVARVKPKGRKPPRNARLDPSLHNSIVSELTTLLRKDGSFAATYLDSVLLSKYVGPETDPLELRVQRAVDKWLATELRNRKTNWRLIEFQPDHASHDFGWVSSSALIRTARRFIRQIIGDTPPDDIYFGNFTSGASTSRRREPGALFRKFAYQADVTEEALPFVLPMFHGFDAWVLHSAFRKPPGYRTVEGNIMFTVPKTSEIERVAAKEPDYNLFAQSGVGSFIRQRLKVRAGIDLNDQSINRSLALEGSISGELATIDLSSASDSVSTQLVYALLPSEWAVSLDVVRSQRTTLIDGTVHANEMFSSMGNGFTFELESLLFYSLVRAIAYHSGTKGRVSVYGDDIICPSSVAPRVARCFNWFGFTVNTKKSFWKGHFRESCGGHYYRGEDVTPFYIKEPIDTVERLIHFLNRLRKWAAAGGLRREGYHALWAKYSKYVDSRLFGGWNVEDPRALVSTRRSRSVYYRLERVKVELIPPQFSSVSQPRAPKRGYKALVEEDALHIGGYLYALRSIDGRPCSFFRSEEPVSGQVFFPDEVSTLFSPIVEELGWYRAVKNTLPSWHSGHVPQFPEEYWGCGDVDA